MIHKYECYGLMTKVVTVHFRGLFLRPNELGIFVLLNYGKLINKMY